MAYDYNIQYNNQKNLLTEIYFNNVFNLLHPKRYSTVYITRIEAAVAVHAFRWLSLEFKDNLYIASSRPGGATE